MPTAELRARGAAAVPARLRSALAFVARALLRPFGYLAFAVALASLAACARLLGERDELGYFVARLSATLHRYPEVTRRGVIAAWASWAILVGVAISSLDPLATDWDEVALAAAGVVVALRGLLVARRAGR